MGRPSGSLKKRKRLWVYSSVRTGSWAMWRGVQLCCRRGYIVYLEGEVAQPRSFGIGEARGWSGEGEELYDIGVAEVAVGLPRVALAAIVFATDFEPEHFGVEALGPTVVATDYGYVVYMVEFHCL